MPFTYSDFYWKLIDDNEAYNEKSSVVAAKLYIYLRSHLQLVNYTFFINILKHNFKSFDQNQLFTLPYVTKKRNVFKIQRAQSHIWTSRI